MLARENPSALARALDDDKDKIEHDVFWEAVHAWRGRGAFTRVDLMKRVLRRLGGANQDMALLALARGHGAIARTVVDALPPPSAPKEGRRLVMQAICRRWSDRWSPGLLVSVFARTEWQGDVEGYALGSGRGSGPPRDLEYAVPDWSYRSTVLNCAFLLCVKGSLTLVREIGNTEDGDFAIRRRLLHLLVPCTRLELEAYCYSLSLSRWR